MKYIIGNNDSDVDVYESIEDFNANFNITLEVDDVPWCYWGFIQYTNNLPLDAEVSWYLNELSKNYGDEFILSFSVTSRESRHQEWLDAVAGVPGATVTKMARIGGNNHKYLVYLCSFPVSPSFEDI